MRLKKRLIERTGKLNEVSDARLEDFETLTRSYEVPAEVGKCHLVAVQTERSFEATVVETLEALAQRAPCGAKNEEAEADAGIPEGI